MKTPHEEAIAMLDWQLGYYEENSLCMYSIHANYHWITGAINMAERLNAITITEGSEYVKKTQEIKDKVIDKYKESQ